MLTWAAHSGTVGFHPDAASLWLALALIAFVMCVGAVMVPLLGVAVSRAWGWLRSWRGRRRRLGAAAHAEGRARAMMSELCPHGWRAQITLFADADPDDHRPLTPHGRRAQVALDWTELHDGSRPAVMRRVWAGSVAEALEAMVADRRTDETLEQIERGAVADGVRWPDL
ncbi:MAG TPA: hypothetical protein VHW96_22290 [Solirubrobacteraceae bacterium]|nr:hypothetical protein [Solirubrobacteraceae bacterium]